MTLKPSNTEESNNGLITHDIVCALFKRGYQVYVTKIQLTRNNQVYI
jgi:hypothetical protein